MKTRRIQSLSHWHKMAMFWAGFPEKKIFRRVIHRKTKWGFIYYIYLKHLVSTGFSFRFFNQTTQKKESVELKRSCSVLGLWLEHCAVCTVNGCNWRCQTNFWHYFEIQKCVLSRWVHFLTKNCSNYAALILTKLCINKLQRRKFSAS